MKNLIGTLAGLLGGLSRSRLQIAVVVPRIVKFDGTSNAIRDTIRAISEVADWRLSIFCKVSEYDGIAVHRVTGPADLSARSLFRSADVIVYHFGLYDDLFEVIENGNGKAVQILLFHNVTPAQYMPEAQRPLIAQSFDQIKYFNKLDRLWPFTTTNAEVLLQAGVDRDRIEVVNPVVEWPKRRSLAQKAASPIEILFVGRMTSSKGVVDLLEATQLASAECRVAFRVSLVGNPVEKPYLDAVRERAARMSPIVEFVGRCEESELQRRYHAAHILAIPSYHEGFCRPVAEGLRAGCIAVGYASFHIPRVANGLGRLVKPGDIEALARALTAMIESVSAAIRSPSHGSLPLDRGPTTLSEFDHLASDREADFTFERFSRTVINRIRNLTSGEPRTNPE